MIMTGTASIEERCERTANRWCTESEVDVDVNVFVVGPSPDQTGKTGRRRRSAMCVKPLTQALIAEG